MKNRIKKGIVYQLKNNTNCFVEIVAVKNSKVKVLAYCNNGGEYIDVNCSDLEGILLTAPILKSLGFEEKDGPLFTLPNEHYWHKYIDDTDLSIIKEDGAFKIVQYKENAYYGVEFLPLSFLHELQGTIGNIDTKKLFKDVYNDVK